VGWKLLDELKQQKAVLRAKNTGWMIVEMANINAKNGVEKHQRVKVQIQLDASHVDGAGYTEYDVKGCEIILGIR
jgi:hypothetical protein